MSLHRWLRNLLIVGLSLAVVVPVATGALPCSADGTIPADTELVSVGASRIRALTNCFVDVFGLPSATNITAAVGSATTTGHYTFGQSFTTFLGQLRAVLGAAITGPVSITGNVQITANTGTGFILVGPTQITGTVSVGGNVAITGNLTVSGTGASSVGGTLAVNGGPLGTSGILGLLQSGNNNDTLVLRRATDVGPGGRFIQTQTSAGASGGFAVDVTGNTTANNLTINGSCTGCPGLSTMSFVTSSTRVSTSGNNSYVEAQALTFTKATAGTRLIVTTNLSCFTDRGVSTPPSVLRVQISGRNFDAVSGFDSSAGNQAVIYHGTAVFTGVAAGAVTASVQVGNSGATAWNCVINPTSADIAHLPASGTQSTFFVYEN